MWIIVAAGCSRATHDQRVSQTPPTAATAASAPAAAATPIPGHPPVTTTGIVASFDPATGILTFEDGRVVKVADRTKILQPVETRAVRRGEQAIVHDALPVGIRSAASIPGSGASATGKRQRMATVARVDDQNHNVWLTDGSAIRVTPSTKVHMGTAGKTVVLTDLRPGDELVIVMVDDGATSATSRDTTPGPSALPRETTAAAPGEASEVMVFRSPQAP
jgi:hypothetical protein